MAESNVDETPPSGARLSPRALALHLAKEKAAAVAARYPRAAVIAADTVVSAGKKCLGKPASKKEALQMLLFLNGKRHEVTTGVAVASGGKIRTASCTTQVWFRKHEAEFLKWYVETGEPMDKAGAYGIQGIGALLVEKIHGDYFNVVGLPLARALDLLSAAAPQIARRSTSKGNFFS